MAKRLRERVSLRGEFKLLKTAPGIGETLVTTIMLETGTIARFAQVGNFSSCGRCVDSLRESNGIVGIKALAHTLARACYHMLREQKSFNVNRCFS